MTTCKPIMKDNQRPKEEDSDLVAWSRPMEHFHSSNSFYFQVTLNYLWKEWIAFSIEISLK
jgi:hypothetical protein